MQPCRNKHHPDPDYLKARLEIVDGKLYWKSRPREDFRSERDWKIWTSRYAGAAAGNVHSAGYHRTMVDGESYLSGRLVLLMTTGTWWDEVGYVDGDGTNLDPSNLVGAMRRRRR